MLSNTAYDVGKRLVQVFIPAISALYFGLAAIWNLPAAEQVVGTLAVLATFLGVFLGLSSKVYNDSNAPYDGKVIVTSTEGGPKVFSLELDGDPEELEKKDSIRFKVASIADFVDPTL